MSRCSGLAGLLFGHQFVKVGWTRTDYCFRCGLRAAIERRRAGAPRPMNETVRGYLYLRISP